MPIPPGCKISPAYPLLGPTRYYAVCESSSLQTLFSILQPAGLREGNGRWV